MTKKRESVGDRIESISDAHRLDVTVRFRYDDHCWIGWLGVPPIVTTAPKLSLEETLTALEPPTKGRSRKAVILD